MTCSAKPKFRHSTKRKTHYVINIRAGEVGDVSEIRELRGILTRLHIALEIVEVPMA